jgi:hypothetical protein
MSSNNRIITLLKACLLVPAILITPACAQLSAAQTSLMQDPASQTQAALASQIAAPATPIPSATFTPVPLEATAIPKPSITPTSDKPKLCAASDLLINVRANINGNWMVFTVSLSNTSNAGCILSQPAKATLATQQGVPLDLDANPGCAECQPKSPIPENEKTRVALIPTQTAVAQASAAGQLPLAAGQTANVVMRWVNWCNPLPPGGVAIRLDIASSQFLLPTNAERGGTCTAPDTRSTLDISPFYYGS